MADDRAGQPPGTAVEYSPGYQSDHWCRRGHVLLVLEGELLTELQDGGQATLTPGTSYQVADDAPAHRSRSPKGAKLFIVDRALDRRLDRVPHDRRPRRGLSWDFLAKGGHMHPSTKPSLRFFHSAALRTRTTKVLSAIDKDPDATRHVGALSSVVVDLTEAGLDYYFLRPLQQAKVGFVGRQTANLGMAGALRVMSPIIRSILAGANTTQLRSIGGHIRHLM